MACNEIALKNYEKWLAYPALDAASRRELTAIAGNDAEIESRFTAPLSFGTAGLRGVMEAGTARMNLYTVRQATQGLSALVLAENAADRGVAIAYDSRHNSRLFAEGAAAVLAANGIKVYLFDDLRPTPELSFALRYLHCIAGINITASHNPKEYNGYKAYWEDGAQLPPEHADTVSRAIDAVDIFTDVKTCDLAAAKAAGKVILIGKEIDAIYLDHVYAERLAPAGVDRAAKEMSLVYTPLHGAGWKLVPAMLRRMGFARLTVVPSQEQPDGDFPTAKKPNPEMPDVFLPGIAIAEKTGADLVIATDPDCDRVGVMTRNRAGEFVRITGNGMGALLLDYICTVLRAEGGIPADAYAVKSIVSTELFSKICETNGVTLHNVLTGFKFIGEVIKNHEGKPGTYLLGFEESYGYLKGTYARDKDAVCGAMLIAEMAAYYRTKNMTLADAFDDLLARYGQFAEKTENIDFPLFGGAEKMAKVTRDLRANPPKTIMGAPVVAIGDYREQCVTDLATGKKSPTGLPSADVLRYALANGDVVIVRPSGTEPKVKVYFLCSAPDAAALAAKMDGCRRIAESLCGM